jgi:hypothetical protein
MKPPVSRYRNTKRLEEGSKSLTKFSQRSLAQRKFDRSAQLVAACSGFANLITKNKFNPAFISPDGEPFKLTNCASTFNYPRRVAVIGTCRCDKRQTWPSTRARMENSAFSRCNGRRPFLTSRINFQARFDRKIISTYLLPGAAVQEAVTRDVLLCRRTQ